MHKLESDFGQNDKLPLYENTNLVDWKLVNKKVDTVLHEKETTDIVKEKIQKEEKKELLTNNPENIIKNANRAWSSLDEKGEHLTQKDIQNTDSLISEIEARFPEIRMFAAEQYL